MLEEMSLIMLKEKLMRVEFLYGFVRFKNWSLHRMSSQILHFYTTWMPSLEHISHRSQSAGENMCLQ